MNEFDNFNLSGQDTQEKKTHSKLGIASFILAIVSIISFLVSIALSVMFISKEGTNIDPNQLASDMFNSSKYLTIILSGVLMWLCVFVNLVGTGLGIAGLIQKTHKKVFSIIGFIFNVLPLILVIALIVFSFYVISSSGGIQVPQ